MLLKPSTFCRDFCSSFILEEDKSVAALGMRGMGFIANFEGQARPAGKRKSVILGYSVTKTEENTALHD